MAETEGKNGNQKEVILYLVFGTFTFFLNIALFYLLHNIGGMNVLVANVICWICCVLFQFFTNRHWVFEGGKNGKMSLPKQMASFFGGRLFTLVVEELILFVFITLMGMSSMPVKMAAQVVVIVLNYVISKFYVFR